MDSENTTNKGFEFDPEKDKEKFAGETAKQSTDYQGSGNTTQQMPGETKMQQPLPNSGGILAMGIISIVLFCCCYGIISVALGIIALVLSVIFSSIDFGSILYVFSSISAKTGVPP